MQIEEKEQMASALVAIGNISSNSTVITEQMRRANDLEERKIRLEEQKMKADEMKLRMELAKALGDRRLLESLMKSMNPDEATEPTTESTTEPTTTEANG